MSPLAIPASITAALPALNIHPHGHGHKKGLETDPSVDSTSSTAAQIPVASAQNLFGKAFTALEKLIGLQPPSVASNPATTASTSPAATAAAATGAKINLMA